MDLCLLLEGMLRNERLNTVSINTLSEIDEKIMPLNIDLIFLDKHLPDSSGIGHVPNIRNKLPQAKIVMMTAFNTENEREEAMESGADIFLLKPPSRSEIENTLAQLHFKH